MEMAVSRYRSLPGEPRKDFHLSYRSAMHPLDLRPRTDSLDSLNSIPLFPHFHFELLYLLSGKQESRDRKVEVVEGDYSRLHSNFSDGNGTNELEEVKLIRGRGSHRSLLGRERGVEDCHLELLLSNEID